MSQELDSICTKQNNTTPPSREATTGVKTMSTHHGILLHVVFSTKYRKPILLDEWRDDLYAYIGGIVKNHKSTESKVPGVIVSHHCSVALAADAVTMFCNSGKHIEGNHCPEVQPSQRTRNILPATLRE